MVASRKKAAEQLRDFFFLSSGADTTETVESWFPEAISLMLFLPYARSQIFMVIQSFVLVFNEKASHNGACLMQVPVTS